jgi:acyl carrier protein
VANEGRQVVTPRDEIEEKIANCWRDLLKIDRLGIDDNFFELGGHSLLATQAVSRLREMFTMPLALRSIFDAPTVVGMAEVVRDASSTHGDHGEREEIEL